MTHAWFTGLHCNGHDQMWRVNFTHLSPDEQGAVGNSFKICARNEIFEALTRWRIGKRHTLWFATAKVAALKGTVKRNEKLLNVSAFRQEVVDLGLFRIILEDRLPARQTLDRFPAENLFGSRNRSIVGDAKTDPDDTM